MSNPSTRPAYSSQPTSTTVVSSSTASQSSISRSSIGGRSTTLTTPSLGPSPNPKVGLQGLVEVFEDSSSQSTHSESPRHGLGIIPLDMSLQRSGTVRDRALQFENQAIASSSTTSTSPLRIKTRPSASHAPLTTPRKSSRVPVPRNTPPSGSRRASPGLKRGAGSARKMIQQWEAAPGTPKTNVTSAGRAGVGAGIGEKIVLSRDYLNDKPLPVPNPLRTPQAQKTMPSTYRLSTPPKSAPAKPSYHLQTPQQRSYSPRTPLGASPSSAYSVNLSPSPSGNVRAKRKGGKSPLTERSPLKEILQVFGGGINGRRGKGKGRGKSVSPSPSMDQLGTNGLPGGIVYRDRMGDTEMGDSLSKGTVWQAGLAQQSANLVKTSPIIYLVPTPCSSYSSWGSWLPSHATLTTTTLQITYTPVFPSTRRGSGVAGSGSNTPRDSTPPPPATFAKVPLPEPGQRPDVELAMKDCVEVRSLRKEEMKGRGVPRIPDMNGVEVLELLWQDGSKRYLGVEGVAGRLGWVSAIWDVLLACKSNIPLTLPPPSPQMHTPRQVSGLRNSSGGASSLASFPFPASSQPTRPELSDFQARIANLEAKAAGATAQPVQKVGDMWVTEAGALRIASGSGTVEEHQPSDLRDSVKRMFDEGPSRRSRPASLKETWQPASERDLSIFARSDSKRSTASQDAIPLSESPLSSVSYKQTSDTQLSFDPNDLNPSRSASQVRRAPSTVLGGFKGLGHGVPSMSRVDEANSREPSLITRMTFPKAVVAGDLVTRTASPSSGSSGEDTYLPTPRTMAVTPKPDDCQIMSKLESHSQDHVTLATQIDGVQVNLQTVIQSLTTLAKAQQGEEKNLPARAIEDKLASLQLDFRGVQDALQLNTLATAREVPPSGLAEVNEKLDAITRLCQDALARHANAVLSAEGAKALSGNWDSKPLTDEDTTPSAIGLDTEEEENAGAEVAEIMTQTTGTLSEHSKVGPTVVSAESDGAPNSLSDKALHQVSEVLELVKELQGARTVQTQQTTDIARYLNELNGWLEKFVKNGTSELGTMSTRLDRVMSEIAPAALVTEMHAMVTEQKRRNDTEGLVGQRLDALLQMMGEEKARQAQQQNAVEQVAALLERQRGDSEMMLRALATDLTGEIRGERIRFVEAMEKATSVNVALHMDEFKNLLSQEVRRAISELGQMREQKMALEHQISDLFALKAKHATGRVPTPSPGLRQSPLPPAGSPRNLPPHPVR